MLREISYHDMDELIKELGIASWSEQPDFSPAMIVFDIGGQIIIVKWLVWRQVRRWYAWFYLMRNINHPKTELARERFHIAALASIIEAM